MIGRAPGIHRALAAMGCALVLASCGIPLQSSPEMVELDIAPTAAQPGEVAGATGTAIYLVDDDRVTRVRRDPAADPTEVLRHLLLGPTPEESARGLRSAVPPSTVVREVSATDGNAVVSLSRDFTAVGGNEEILAVAQIVLTLTANGAEQVTILLEGAPTPVPLPDGELVDRPVDAADYEALSGA